MLSLLEAFYKLKENSNEKDNKNMFEPRTKRRKVDNS